MIYEIAKHPIVTKATETDAKHIPVLSKVNRGINNLDRIVNMGEKRRITSVFFPIK